MYKLALKLNKPKGETYVTYNNLGAAYFYLDDFEQAIKEFTRAYAVNPQAMSEKICVNIEAVIKAQGLKSEKGINFETLVSGMKDKNRKIYEEINLSEQCVANWQLP